ncbi:MAG TPA: response regulator [Candidatus Limnocylindrales bacterium]|nr:response regulator [Candidatus Limnocylindrales bacterium]
MQPAPGEPGRLRVVVIDADDRVRESLVGLLCIGERLMVVGDAGQAAAGLDVVLATEPDIVVIDPRLPDLDGGTALIHRVRAAAPRVRILVMGAPSLEGSDLQRAGDGFVRKTFRPSDLVAAVVAAAVPLAS